MAPEKKIIWFAFVLTVIVLIPSANAVFELPESSWYSGSRTFAHSTENGDFVSGRIDFAVYNTEVSRDRDAVLTFDEYDFGDDGFVYAYQIFNNADNFGSNPIAFFGLLNIAGVPIQEVSPVNNTNWSSNSPDFMPREEDSVPPVATLAQGTWEFGGSSGLLLEGKDSWFLLMSSPNDWTPGGYEIKTQLDFVPVPIPEPASIMFFAAIGVMTLIRKNKSV